ncbi:hypothetical protein LZ086_06975 [Acinetobacter johnsonii]|nr:hypothetical protein LZ086_06975 [Acinetobacter johnsonii]
MAGIRLEFAQFGDFDSFDIVRSPTSMAGVADANLPTPIATDLKTMYYVDTNIVENSIYYYKVRVWRGAISVVSSEIRVVADLYWENISSLLNFDGANNSTVFTDEKGTIWSRNGSPIISTAQSKFGGSSGRFSKITTFRPTLWRHFYLVRVRTLPLRRGYTYRPAHQFMIRKFQYFVLVRKTYQLRVVAGISVFLTKRMQLFDSNVTVLIIKP